MVLKVILKSGVEFKVSCKNFKGDTLSSGEISSYKFEDVYVNLERGFVYPAFINKKDIAAILKLTND
jgi:hypothetical protein